MPKPHHHRLRRAVLAALAAPSLLAQNTTTITCSLDNTLYESATGSFSNALGDLFVGVTAQGKLRRPLLRFDVAAALPPTAMVLSATLQLEVTASGAPANTTARVHAMTRSWGEGTSLAITGGGGQGAPATPGDATWLHALAPGSFWTVPGGDHAATVQGSVDLPVSGTALGTLDAVLVQAWLASPATNHGITLLTAEQLPLDRARRFASRETPGFGPRLTVTWLQPGATGSFGTGCALGGTPPMLSFVGAPLGGSAITIAHTQAPATSVGVDVFALGLAPLGTVLTGTCTVFLTDPLIFGSVFTTDGAGTATTSLFLPAGFPSVLVAGQAAIFDGSALGFALTDAALLVTP